MSPLRIQDRLDELARAVRRLCVATVESERAMGDFDGIDDEEAARAAAVAFETRLRRDAALIQYFEANEEERAQKCSTHGDSLFASCGDCMAVIRARRAA